MGAQSRAPAGSRTRTVVLALAVGCVLADSSVVVLGLPDILATFSTTVEHVAWVITAFNLAVALTAVPSALIGRRSGARALFAGGVVVFAGGSLACGLAPSLAFLITARCVQAVGGGALVGAALELLVEERGSESGAATVWVFAAAAGAAAGPAIGGLLTQAFTWRAIFFAQVPVLLALWAIAQRRPQPRYGRPAVRPAVAPNAALLLVSAALAAALFLLVLLLVDGFGRSPLAAAIAVSAIPIAAVLTSVVNSRPRRGAATAGCLVIAGGLAGLGLLPASSIAWTLAPQVLIGVGLALALPTLSHAALERHPLAVHGAWTVSFRHAGVVLGLLLLTPILVTDLSTQTARAQDAGSAVVLDSNLSFTAKLNLGEALLRQLESSGGEHVPDLKPVFAGRGGSPQTRAAYAAIERDLNDEIHRAVTRAFRRAFLVAAVLALAAALVAAAVTERRELRSLTLALAGVAAIAVPAVFLQQGAASYGPKAAPDPCLPRHWPSTGSVSAVADQVALSALNGAACRLHVPAATLALAISTPQRLADFRRRQGISDAQFSEIIRAGLTQAVDDGEHSGDINALEAAAMRFALANVPESWLRDELPRVLSLVQ